MLGVGEHDVVQQLGGEPEVTGSRRPPGRARPPVGAAERVDVARGQLDGRVLPQVRRVAVEPAHVALVDRLHVVADRAVVAVGVPGVVRGRAAARSARRSRPRCGPGSSGAGSGRAGRRRGHAGCERYVTTRSRPHVGQWWEANATSAVGAEQVDRLGQVVRPDVRVADERAPQGQQVVQVVGGVLGHAQRPILAGSRSASRPGASVPGVIWNSMRTPSSVSSWPVCGDVRRGHDQTDLTGRRRSARGRRRSGPAGPVRAPRRTCSRRVGSSPCPRRRSPRPRAR